MLCLLPDSSGKEAVVSIEEWNDDYVKFGGNGSSAARFVPMASFSADLQAVVKLLPSKLYFSYPMDYVLTGPPSPGAKIQFLGRNDEYVKFSNLADHSIHYEPLALFSASDQAIVQKLSRIMTVEMPVEHSLTTLDGQHLPATILAVSANLVALQLPTDGSTRYYPVSDLALPDQKFLRILPENLSLGTPLECTVSDASGNPMRVRIDGRAAKFVKLTQLATGATEFRLFSDFSLVDARVLQMLPQNLALRYPFDFTLDDTAGRPVKVQILGRSADTLKYRLLNGTTQNIAMSKLTPHDQEFISALPVTLSSADVAPPPAAKLPDSPVVANLRAHILGLERRNKELDVTMNNPNTGAMDKQLAAAELQRNQDQIAADQRKIDLELAKTPSR